MSTYVHTLFFPKGLFGIKIGLKVKNDHPSKFSNLRWLKTVSSAYIWMGRYNHSLSLDATIMVSKNYPIIAEHVGIIFLTQ